MQWDLWLITTILSVATIGIYLQPFSLVLRRMSKGYKMYVDMAQLIFSRQHCITNVKQVHFNGVLFLICLTEICEFKTQRNIYNSMTIMPIDPYCTLSTMFPLLKRLYINCRQMITYNDTMKT